MSKDRFNIGHTVCSCGRWWTSLREAIEYDGYNCIDNVKSCDYCRDDEKCDGDNIGSE